MSSPTRQTTDPALVLIAEDEEPLAETVAFVVQGAGYRPLVALHGRQALELARARRPALVITDLMLPHLDGAGLIAALRAEAAAGGEAAPPIVLMTAASLALARAAGADVVLRKPFHLVDLEALLRGFLGPPPATEADPPAPDG
jgi:DNA-binding response OmpR family regulator